MKYKLGYTEEECVTMEKEKRKAEEIDAKVTGRCGSA